MLGFWIPYPLFRPKKAAVYQCTVLYSDDEEKRYVIDLYFDTIEHKWVDKRRQSVFDGYKVYKSCREPMEHNRVYSDSLCERSNVVAWRKLHKPYRFGKRRTNYYE